MPTNVVPVHCVVTLLFLITVGATGCKPAALSHRPQANLPGETSIPAPSQTEGNVLILTIVYDNYQYDPDLQTGWGFACLVEGLIKTVLFDTGGDRRILLSNMSKLGLDPDDVDVVVLSHIHRDHTGGLAGLLERNPHMTVFVAPSFPSTFKSGVTGTGAQCVGAAKGTEICEHAFSTGEVGTAIKEQALAIETTHGLVVITGCAHPGVVNMVRRAKEMLDEEIYLVTGGFHMSGFSDREINRVIGALGELGVQKVGPCHCSGDRTRQLFASAFGEDFIKAGVGKKLTIRP